MLLNLADCDCDFSNDFWPLAQFFVVSCFRDLNTTVKLVGSRKHESTKGMLRFTACFRRLAEWARKMGVKI